MSESVQKQALNEAFNGIKTPRYFDRQVVRASDLNLDRKSHDEELERMRRLLHGWGIVGGLDVIQFGDEFDNLVVGRGYGVTPTGEEIFLREHLEVNDLAAHILACCGPGSVDCNIVDETEIERRVAEDEITAVTSWLIARPTRTLDEPRPGVAQGCEHPANMLLPTRSCEGVRLELLCSIPPPHDTAPAPCEELAPHFCAETRESTQPFLAMPEAYGNELSFLVLCKLICVTAEGKFTVTMSPVNRKTLLPGSVIQQFLTACVCPVLKGATPPPEDDGDGGIIPRPPIRDDWEDLEDLLNNPPIHGPVTDPPPFRDRLNFIFKRGMIEKFGEAGIDGPKAFLGADAEMIARVTGLTPEAVKKAQVELDGVRHLLPGLRF
jgi:hypothetical protein